MKSMKFINATGIEIKINNKQTILVFKGNKKNCLDIEKLEKEMKLIYGIHGYNIKRCK